MTFEEFDSALAKLTAAKFVVINKNGLRLSPAGKRLFVSASMKRNLYAQWQTLHSLLHASEDPADPQWKDPDWSNSYFTAEQFQIAVGTYLNRFRRLK